MERWTGRVAVVTGSSAGMGMTLAEELVKKGLKVAGLARRIDRIQVGPNIFVGAPSTNSDICGCVTVRDLLDFIFNKS
jgi:NAD(P)-dependent dehydrogenase (short-subunit alcohol dehydrogenase family)